MLLERFHITHDTILLSFALPAEDSGKPLGLSTCACILAQFTDEESSETVTRPYTPVSTNAMIGKFQLCVKVYEKGKMSKHLAELAIGASVEFKHVAQNVKIQYPFKKQFITMLVGGTGITPMLQALHAILGTATDETQVTMLFGNRTEQDILCRELLDAWESAFNNRFKVVHILSHAQDDQSWLGERGFIDRKMVEKYSAPPNSDVLMMVCGPPPMYNALCGARDVAALSGTLNDMGYTVDQVFKF